LLVTETNEQIVEMKQRLYLLHRAPAIWSAYLPT